MSGIQHPISFLYRLFHENVKKSSIPKCHEWSLRYHSYLDSSIENVKKKARYPNVMNWVSDIIYVWIFPWKCLKRLRTQMSWIRHPMSFLNGFCLENVQKKLDTQMSCIKHPISFLYGFFLWKCQKKKLDTKMPRVKHHISFWYGTFNETKQHAVSTCTRWWKFKWKYETQIPPWCSEFRIAQNFAFELPTQTWKICAFLQTSTQVYKQASAKPSRSNPASNDTHRRS